MPGIDTQIIGRSAKLLDRYGPDFRYRHHVVVARLAPVAGFGLGAPLFVAAAQFPPTRNAMLKRFPAGEGPSEEVRAKSHFEVTFVGRAGGEQVITRFAGGDPGYDETAKMLGESALCMAFDNVADIAGQVTTAAAMGDALVERLQKAGLTIEVAG
jgi:saccharopine dehydrogenase (NAD+, L-glutamate forming)